MKAEIIDTKQAVKDFIDGLLDLDTLKIYDSSEDYLVEVDELKLNEIIEHGKNFVAIKLIKD
jgi:hypothetical protein